MSPKGSQSIRRVGVCAEFAALLWMGEWAAQSGPLQSQPPRSAHAVTYAHDIAPLLDRACVGCHRPGQAAPFALQTYADARKRAVLIAQVTQRRYMPPWLPEPGDPPLVGHRELAPSQIALLQQWVKAGMPEGNRRERPTPPSFPVGWRLGKPDLIVKMPRPFMLAAEGNEVCPSFVLPLSLPEDRWIRAIDVHPSNPRIVRAASLFVDTEGKARRLADQSGANGYFAYGAGLNAVRNRLGDWTSGGNPLVLPADAALPLPKGTDLALMLRCQTDGQPEQEQTEIGLYFAPSRPRLTPFLIALGAVEMFLKANQTATVTETVTLPAAVRVLRMVPHADPICAHISLTATLPDRTMRSLLQIKNWNAHWAEPYQWTSPLSLPAGTRLSLTAFFDNTKANPNNANRPLMVSQPSMEFMDENGGIQLLLMAEQRSDEPELRRVLQNPSGTLQVERKGGQGHG